MASSAILKSASANFGSMVGGKMFHGELLDVCSVSVCGNQCACAPTSLGIQLSDLRYPGSYSDVGSYAGPASYYRGSLSLAPLPLAALSLSLEERLPQN